MSATNECKIEKVQHNNQALDMIDNEYPLPSFSGNLSITYKDRKSNELQLCNNAPMIFKLPPGWKGDGRETNRMATGNFIVIAPCEWNRIDPAGSEAGECTDTNFVGHYFYLDKEPTKSTEIGFKEYQLPISTNSEICLSGNLIFDNSTEGKLYVGAPPKLIPGNRVMWAQVGEEQENGWRSRNFDPNQTSLEETLGGRQGRFFLRVYDNQSVRLSSTEFRYLQDLRKILVNDEIYTESTLLVPRSEGYPPTEIQFIGADNTPLESVLLISNSPMVTQSESNIIAQPCQNENDISCTLSSGLHSINIVIKLPYIWWRVRSENNGLSKWRSTPWKITQQMYRERANQNRRN